MNKSCQSFWLIIMISAGLLLSNRSVVMAAASADTTESQRPLITAQDWVIGLCAFQTEAFDPSGRLAVDIAVHSLGRSILAMAVHHNSAEERLAAESQLSRTNRESAEKNLITQRNNRDLILFQGLAAWKIEPAQATADKAVETAIQQLEQSVTTRPLAAETRPMVLAKENQTGSLLPAPQPGEEAAYCREKRIDALLFGWAEPFYERLLLNVSLYVLAVDQVVHQEEIIFSPDNRQLALADLGSRLAAAALGVRPAALTVVASGADIMIDGHFYGRNITGPIERPAGPVMLEVSSSGYLPVTMELDLEAGKLTTIALDLVPIRFNQVELTAVGTDEWSSGNTQLRSGALHLGALPAVVNLAENSSGFFIAETDSGQAELVVGADDQSWRFRLNPKDFDPDAVSHSRKSFYTAFGRFSIMLPVAFLASGIARTYRDRAMLEGSNQAALMAGRIEYLSGILWATTGLFVAEAVYRFYGFIVQASRRFPLTKTSLKDTIS